MPPDLWGALREHGDLRQKLLTVYPDLAEAPETLQDTLEGITKLDDQIVAAMRWIMGREDDAEAIGKRIEKLMARKRRLEEGARSGRGVILHAMQEGGLKKIVAPDFSLSVRQTKPKIVITDEAAVPDHLCKIERTPSKTMIADELAAGRDVPGAQKGNAAPFLVVRTS